MRMLFVLFLLLAGGAKAQITIAQEPELQIIRNGISNNFISKYQLFNQSKTEILLRANQKKIPVIIGLENGNIAELRFFDDLGFPHYVTTLNMGAASSVGTTALQPGGSLGLNLTGKGFVVGIYDQTRPKPDHAEFTGRLTQIDGSTETISNHATHVSGTVLASGINPSARGMASEATGWSFNWDSDLSKMFANAYDPTTKPNGHLVSNHSYGFVLGWFRNSTGAWTWAGNSAVDPNEDYRFGFYSTKSKGLDDLIFVRPQYTVVWAAGNDRTDVGNGTKPSDGPDDTLGPEGVAKNVITVGAVSLLAPYSGPNSVSMSSFSSWGPTDDGRIKPDLVAVGVGVFSSTVANGGTTDSYGSLSGTSMAAPNVTGSLLLLQQLFSQRNNGRFMWASTVKSLVLNTTKEAGLNQGPDYVYGWGLLDVEAAGRIILNENGTSDVIREETISSGEKFDFDFISDGVTPIRVTIAWTDPSGNPPPISLNPQNLMLINDLDMRIVDEEGNTFFPWSLNPAARSSAQAVRNQDNFRDNVEQIFIESPKPQKYRVSISHKGALVGGKQEFSLVLTAGTTDGASETLYWIGGTMGNWNNPANWSITPNGPSADKIPTASSRVVFEGSGVDSQVIGFPSDAQAFSVNLFGSQLVKFDLKGNQISVTNGFRVSNQITEIENGTILFESGSSNEHLVELGQAIFSNATLNFKSGKWKILTAEILDKLIINEAEVSVNVGSLALSSLNVNATGILGGIVQSITFKNDFTVGNGSKIPGDLSLVYTGSTGEINNLSGITVENLSIQSGLLVHLTGAISNLTIVNGEYVLGQASSQVNNLKLGNSSILNLGATGQIVILDKIEVDASASNFAVIKAGSAGKFIHDFYLKYCFEHVSVTNVNLEGKAIINLGESAQIINSSGWVAKKCEDVLFANFKTAFTCVGSLVSFENLSEGAIKSFKWDFGGQGSSTLSNPSFVFNSPGIFIVKLEISNDDQIISFDREITISANDLLKPVIVVNGSLLTSQQPAAQYQWFINGQPIPGATQRSIEATDDGSYQVAVFNDTCNRISDATVISSIPEPDLSVFGIFVGPVPSQDKLDVSITNDFVGPVYFTLTDMSGRKYLEEEVTKSSNKLLKTFSLPNPRGLYILKIQTNNLILHKKVIKY
ncbi:S8 family serine peptidase [Algoriphagus sp.]|uniref:S8 family serine peptidase n=1 Tax=Algoriphagus sp. TaxID=1872435 RepID=UPI003919687E